MQAHLGSSLGFAMDLRVCCGASMAGVTLQVTVLLLGSAKCALQLHQLSLLVVIWISGFFYLTSEIHGL